MNVDGEFRSVPIATRSVEEKGTVNCSLFFVPDNTSMHQKYKVRRARMFEATGNRGTLFPSSSLRAFNPRRGYYFESMGTWNPAPCSPLRPASTPPARRQAGPKLWALVLDFQPDSCRIIAFHLVRFPKDRRGAGDESGRPECLYNPIDSKGLRARPSRMHRTPPLFKRSGGIHG
jgi:hypothetical protein